MSSKPCTKCGVIQHTSYFSERSDRPGALMSWCKACMREAQRLSAARSRDRKRGIALEEGPRPYVPPVGFLEMGAPLDRSVALRWAA